LNILALDLVPLMRRVPHSIYRSDRARLTAYYDIRKLRNRLSGLRFHDLRHTAATKLLEHGTPFAVVAQILGWSASTAVRMAKRYGHIRPEVQRQALAAVATTEIQPAVNQIVHQVEAEVESSLVNLLIPRQ